MMNKRITIVVAAHKEYAMPVDKMYIPVFAGAQSKKTEGIPVDFTPDNTGENISALNPYFSELTALYWAWKNLDSDYIGLAHYRRHFSFKRKADLNSVLSFEEIVPFLGKVKIFTPNKRKYYIETLYSHYAHTFDASHLDEAKKIIDERHPEYSACYDRMVNKRSGYMFNMMIMQKDLLDQYCAWLFDILRELRNRVDESKMTAFEKRYPGRVSEILFNVWFDYEITSGTVSENELKEIPIVSMEKVNWLKKGTAFLKAKFLGKKYDTSF